MRRGAEEHEEPDGQFTGRGGRPYRQAVGRRVQGEAEQQG